MVIDVQPASVLLWGSLYVVFKWTIGLWLFRRAKRYVGRRTRPTRAVARATTERKRHRKASYALDSGMSA